jgi:hypothetical protein
MLVRRGLAILAGVAATMVIGSAPAVGSTQAPAACQEYSVCGGPTGGSSSGSLGRPVSPRSRPSVASRVTVPLIGYPLTPALAIGAALVALALVASVALAVVRRGRREVPTSAPAR